MVLVLSSPPQFSRDHVITPFIADRNGDDMSIQHPLEQPRRQDHSR